MKAIILAAGVGSRLRPLTNLKPKCLIKVNGISILEHQILGYLNAGIAENNIFVLTGYLSSLITRFLEEKYPQVNLVENKQYMETNNMYSLYLASQKLIISEFSKVCISNGDCVYDKNIIKELLEDSRANLIATDKGSYDDESMKIIIKEGKVVKISKEISPENAYGNSIDLYKLDFKAFNLLSRIMHQYIEINQDRSKWTEVAIQDLLSECTVHPLDIKHKKWKEIDNLHDLQDADILFSSFNLSSKKCFVMDLDGTVYLGKTSLPKTIKYIKESQGEKDYYFMTNNTSKDLTQYEEKLLNYGIKTDKDNILSPLVPLVDYLKEEKLSHVYCVANIKIQEYLLKEIPELILTADNIKCQALIVTYDTNLNYEKLKNAALLLQKDNIRFLATHEDKVCPTEEGPIPDIGSILSLLETATGRRPDIVFGKPNPILLSNLEKKYDKKEIAIVGDRLYTDRVLAFESGIDFILVLSGETKRQDVEELNIAPSLILSEFGEISQLHR